MDEPGSAVRSFIPACEPLLGGSEKAFVLEALESGWISSSGKYVTEFERSFANYCGASQGIGVCNGTAAIHLALVALGIGRGDEVIVPSFTMIGSVFPVCYTGAMPVFVDALPDTWTMDPAGIEEKITPRTRAIMAVPIYGHPCEMDTVTSIARRHNLTVIEDAAEAHGAMYHGRRCGGLSEIATFSFFANKIITTGEGGMVVTSDEALAERCRYHRNLCFPRDAGSERIYRHEDIGFNYRMSNLIAALGCAQLEKIEDYVAMRRRNHFLYAEYLKDIPGITLQPERPGIRNVFWMNGILIERAVTGISRDALMAALRKKNIETRLFFTGLHRQPALLKYGCGMEGSYPVSDQLEQTGLLLPSGSGLREDQIAFIAETIRALV